MSDAFSTAYMRQELRNLQRDLRQAYDKITELRGYREQDLPLIDRQARELQEKDEIISKMRGEMDMRRAHYTGLLAERDYLLELLDEAHGVDKNPARHLAYTDESFVIESGPRKGQRPQKRDHVFFSAMAAAVKEKFPYLGSWRRLLRDNFLFK